MKIYTYVSRRNGVWFDNHACRMDDQSKVEDFVKKSLIETYVGGPGLTTEIQDNVGYAIVVEASYGRIHKTVKE